MPSSFLSAHAASHSSSGMPEVSDQGSPDFFDDPFMERLIERRQSEHARAQTAARMYRRSQAFQTAGPGQEQRAFKRAAQFLALDTELPHHELRLRTLADALQRHGASPIMGPGRASPLLLCDASGEPHLSFLPLHDAASAAGRASMAASLNDTLRADQSLSVGIDRAVLHDMHGLGKGLLTRTTGARSAKELQAAALGRLFTNDCEAGWQQAPGGDGLPSWHLGACAPFPDHKALRGSLEAMQDLRGPAPLFDIPADAGPAWDDALDPTLACQVRGLDLDSLAWTMALERQAQRKNPAATPPGAEAIRSAIASIRVVRALIDEAPTLTLRQLLERVPHRLDGGDIGSSAARTRKPVVSVAPSPVPKFSRFLQPSPVLAFPAGTPTPPSLIDDTELSALLRAAAPFSPFRRRDRELAPRLREAIALRLMKPGPKKERATSTLLKDSYRALQRIQAEGDRRASGHWERSQATDARATILLRLIADTEHRFEQLRSDSATYTAEASMPGRSWFPWRRGAQRQA